VAGVTAGSGVIGAPTIWAQEIKDIELRHVGVSYSVVKAIGDQAAKDLGFKVTMQNLDTSAAINRFITQPNTVDIPDLEGWQAKLAAKRGVIQGISVKKVKEFDNFLPIFTKGELDGQKIPRQGISPYEAMYIEKAGLDRPSRRRHRNGRRSCRRSTTRTSIGYRPDLVDHPVTEWKDLLDPKYKGKAAILDVPAIGIMDAALCFESAGLIKYGNKGNMTKEEIDFTINKLIELKKSRSLPRHLDHIRSVRPIDGGRRSHHSIDVVASGRRRPCQADPLRVRAGEQERRQGRISWLVQRPRPDEAPDGQKARRRLRVHQLVLHRLARRVCQPLRLLQPGTLDSEKGNDADGVGVLVRRQARAGGIKDPYGVSMEKAGTVRDGGSFLDRVKNISCWNTLMDEAAFMNKRWNDFKVA